MTTTTSNTTTLSLLSERFGELLTVQPTRDGITTAWVQRESVREVLAFLKSGIPQPFRMLYDLSAIDERTRANRPDQPASDFTVFYHLMSFDRNEDIRIKVPLSESDQTLPTITDLWTSANWYEREVWDMFGIRFQGHPLMRRILMPPWWEGHPLRKEHPARATEIGQFALPPEKQAFLQESLKFDPEEYGLKPASPDSEFMFMNLGPQHPGTHGVLRIILQLDGEEIVDAIPDIGYHHRGKEKMGERQTWHTFIPYTDRVDYLGGVINNLPYVMGVEALAGIRVPDRAQMIRIMMCELFRISNHLVWYGTFAQDVGALSPVFYMFNDRERLLQIVESVTGGRLHPSWFRIGGVAADLPRGWDGLVRDFVNYMPARMVEYDKLVMRNRIFKGRTKGVGGLSVEEALDWGVTGPNLRSCGLAWDFRKKRPYMGYDQLEFDIPTAESGDCYDRALVRVEEIRQSLRIIEQCMNNMPPGPIRADHPLSCPPLKERTMKDIETLITHFLNVTWGPVIPAGEAIGNTEGAKGGYGYYLISDGNTQPYRVRIRTASFPHMQMVPHISRGMMIADLLAILGSIDFVLADVDR